MPPTHRTCWDCTLDEIMVRWPATIEVFVRHRMLCVGCLIGPFHTVADACAAYDLDEAAFWDELAAVSPGPAPTSAGAGADR